MDNNNYNNNNYNSGGYNPNNFVYNEPNKPKKSFKGDKKYLKITAVIISALVLAVLGGVIGGIATYNYIKADLKESSKVDYAAPEFASSSDGSLTISEAFQKVKPAVVTITTTSVSQRGFYATESSGMGSGFIISEEGEILTNYHVIKDATDLTVTLSDGTQASAKVVNYDEKRDVAMIKLAEGTNIPGVAELGDSDALYSGEDVIAIGTPLYKDFAQTLTKGVISAPVRALQMSNNSDETLNVIQTDAAINPGNSGGPLVNTKGQVIGINSSKIANVSGSDTSVEGIGFAIPINEVKDKIQSLSKPMLTMGIKVDASNRSNSNGLKVMSVTSGSAADKAGIKTGDYITEFNGKKISTAEELAAAKNEVESGQTVKVVVNRDGKKVELQLTLTEN